MTLEPHETTIISITLQASQSTLGDQQGYLLLTSADFEAHLPAWGRILQPSYTANVLLIDNDGSERFGKTDYLDIYTATLENLGRSYTVLDADGLQVTETVSVLDPVLLAAHQAVIYFTGDNRTQDSLTLTDRYRLHEFAANGGSLLVTGEDARRTIRRGDTGIWLSSGAREFLTWFTLASSYRLDSLTGNQLLPTLIVTPFGRLPFTDTIDLGTAGDGAGNQNSIDVLYDFDGSDAGSLWHGELLTYSVGTIHREQPTLERPGVTWNGRAVYFTFGLEGVNNDTGHATREELLAQFWTWGTETPAAELQTQMTTSRTVTFTASLTNNVAPAVLYRWDLGDGTQIFTTTAGTISHTYSSCTWPGFTAQVEIHNDLGNQAVASVSNLVPCAIQLSLDTTVGAGNECGLSNTLTITSSSPITATTCYTLLNLGEISLDRHALVDTVWGQIPLTATGQFPLMPQEQVTFSATTTLSQTTVATATWSAEPTVGSTGERWEAAATHTVTIMAPPPAPLYPIYLPWIGRPLNEP